MASAFRAYVSKGAEVGTRVVGFVPAQGASEPFIVGDFVVCSTGESGEVEVCGADPTLIAGISEISSEAHRVLTPDGRVPVRIIFGAGVEIALASATTPVRATHVGNSYGITKTGNNWLLDVAKTTTSSRCRVVDVDVDKGIFFVVFHQNVLQFADITVATS